MPNYPHRFHFLVCSIDLVSFQRITLAYCDLLPIPILIDSNYPNVLHDLALPIQQLMPMMETATVPIELELFVVEIVVRVAVVVMIEETFAVELVVLLELM